MTQASTDQVLHLVREKLVAEGIESTTRNGALDIETVQLRLSCEVIAGDVHAALQPFRLLTEQPTFPEPLEDQIAALGFSKEEQAEHAATMWLDSFFRPLHAFLCSPPDARSIAMVTTSPGGDRYGWQIFTTLPAGTRNDTSSDRMELLRCLMTPLNTLLLDSEPHALKCFLMKSPGPVSAPGDRVDASCHFDNCEWLPGLSQLLYLGDDWGPLETLRMRRQWLFFKPATPEMLGDTWTQLTEKLPPPATRAARKRKKPVIRETDLKTPAVKVPWWKFW